jgi:ATP/maltotriose-dependent transcriptional regulator MalT
LISDLTRIQTISEMNQLPSGGVIVHAALNARRAHKRPARTTSLAFEQAGAPVFPATKPGAVMVPGLVEALSARELEVLALLATGKSNRAIAEKLVVTLDTVKRHVTNLFNKLGVASRIQAVAGLASWDCCPNCTARPLPVGVPAGGAGCARVPTPVPTSG